MNSGKALIVLALAGVEQAMAYSSSLADCEAFAALWSGGCGGTNKDAVYKTADWETAGPGAVTSNCATGDDDIEVWAPNTGSKGTDYTLYARNCITCDEDEFVKDKIWIRYQSNNIPKLCYGSDIDKNNNSQTARYPSTQKIDFEVVWNVDVLHKQNVAEDKVADKTKTSALLCNASGFASSTLPSSTGYKENASFSDGSIVGYSMDNVVIYNALTDVNTDVMIDDADKMDACLLSSSSSNFMKYHSISACIGANASKTQVPTLCKDSSSDLCVRNPLTFATGKAPVADLPNEKPMGLAKDGHIIVGPYNKDGELWTCEDHDVCNGVFLSDNSYAYAMTTNFPYVVGCWGPGPQQSYEASCSTRSCSGGFEAAPLAAAVLAGVILAMTQ